MFSTFQMFSGIEKLLQIFQIKFLHKYVDKIKYVQTFTIKKHLKHNFVNSNKRFQAFRMFTGIKQASIGCAQKFVSPHVYINTINIQFMLGETSELGKTSCNLYVTVVNVFLYISMFTGIKYASVNLGSLHYIYTQNYNPGC